MNDILCEKNKIFFIYVVIELLFLFLKMVSICRKFRPDELDYYTNYENEIITSNIYYPNYDYFEQPNFVNEKINVSNFNFNGKCRNVFKYKKNNPKDLIFMTLDSKRKINGKIKNIIFLKLLK